MNRKIIAGILIGVIGCLVGVAFFVGKSRARPAVTVTLRIAVSPREQAEFVTGQANSARFKYLVGKQAGVKPLFAQQLTIKPVPDSEFLEARLGVATQEEAQRYAQAFVGTLQALCGRQVQLGLAAQSIK